jgi:Glyoxalase-like domain
MTSEQMADRILSRQFHAAEGAEAWRVLPEGACAFFRTDSFAVSLRFVDALGGLVRKGDDAVLAARAQVRTPAGQPGRGSDRSARTAGPFWFEQMDELRADGAGTIHLVVWVPWDEAASRVEAALGAGGRLVRHNTEEGFWTLADPAGNEVDVAATSAPNPDI